MNQGQARAVILAAGTSSRVGKQKLLMEFRGRPLIEFAIAAAQRWNPIVVAGHEVDQYLAGRADVVRLANDEPELGMSHSLVLANRFVPSDVAMIVLLGDKPLVSQMLIKTVCDAAGTADVVYPVRGGVPGHPVWLSPHARRCIAALPSGDTLRSLRVHPDLTRHAVKTQDAGAVFDVDTLGAFE
jgi:molybdenum cofactor cytidylyltransferase